MKKVEVEVVEELDEDDAPLPPVQSGRQRKATQVFTVSSSNNRRPIHKKRKGKSATADGMKKRLRDVVKRHAKNTDPAIQAIITDIRKICN